MSKKIFCKNPYCDKEAMYTRARGKEIVPLCATCAVAWDMGHVAASEIKSEPCLSKLQLQVKALEAYSPEGIDNSEICKWSSRDAEKLLKGDTLALFVWREIGDAKGDPGEAECMMDQAIRDLTRVYDGLIKLTPPEYA